MQRRRFIGSLAAGAAVSAPFIGTAQAQAITLHGAVQFNDDHAFKIARQPKAFAYRICRQGNI